MLWPMRLGVLGPAQGDLPALARGAQHLLDEGHAESESAAPLVKRVGPRTFFSPGPLGEGGGAALLDDEHGGVRIEVVNASGAVMAREVVGSSSAASRLRVQGEPRG